MEQTIELMLAKMMAALEKTNDGQEGMLAKTDPFQEVKAGHKEMKVLLEANPEKIKSVAEDQDLRNEDGALGNIETREDRYGDRHLDVGGTR
jgi:hypothetical protein